MSVEELARGSTSSFAKNCPRSQVDRHRDHQELNMRIALNLLYSRLIAIRQRHILVADIYVRLLWSEWLVILSGRWVIVKGS